MNYRETKVVGTRTVRITPQVAIDMLEANKDNRAINGKRIEGYAKIMTEGRWMETGQPIIVSSDGYLIDGQHRLNAIVKSQSTLDLIVITLDAKDGKGELTARNIPVDIGQKRTISNITGIHPRTASIIRQMMYAFELGGQVLSTDPSEIMARYEKIGILVDNAPKKNMKIYTSVFILATFILADYAGYDVWDTYNELLNRNYHNLPEVWSSWMRNIENISSKKGREKEIGYIANTWRLAKSKGKKKVQVKDIQGEFDECKAIYRKMMS